jgi:glycosyltransferase involved in cell wall biosynthesis
LHLLSVVLRSTAALAWAAARTEGDYVHLGKPQPINGAAALMADRLRPRPLYLDCDDYEAGSNRFSAAWQRHVFAWWEDRLPPRMDGVTVNTMFLRDRVARLGVSEDRIVHVPNGVDLQTFKPAPAVQVDALRVALGLEDRRVIAYAGTLSLQNHPVNILLDALPALVRHEPRTALLMIGGGEDLISLRELAVANGLAPFVRFTGHVGRPMLRALLGLAELTVDPVLDDDVARARSPLKILESLALGVPVVTGDSGDRRMLLADGEAGSLMRPGDPAALADGIAGLLADPAALRAKSEYALRHVQAYDWNRLAERFEMVYG